MLSDIVSDQPLLLNRPGLRGCFRESLLADELKKSAHVPRKKSVRMRLKSVFWPEVSMAQNSRSSLRKMRFFRIRHL